MNMHIVDRLPAKALRVALNFWPPFAFSGIKVVFIAEDFREIKVILKARWYNRNYVGTHFGGAMFSMADPFFMLILLKNLNKKYIVWDKAASIEFVKPGRGTLYADFSFSDEELQVIQARADEEKKFIFDKSVNIVNQQGEVVASVLKTLYVRKK